MRRLRRGAQRGLGRYTRILQSGKYFLFPPWLSGALRVRGSLESAALYRLMNFFGWVYKQTFDGESCCAQNDEARGGIGLAHAMPRFAELDILSRPIRRLPMPRMQMAEADLARRNAIAPGRGKIRIPRRVFLSSRAAFAFQFDHERLTAASIVVFLIGGQSDRQPTLYSYQPTAGVVLSESLAQFCLVTDANRLNRTDSSVLSSLRTVGRRRCEEKRTEHRGVPPAARACLDAALYGKPARPVYSFGH